MRLSRILLAGPLFVALTLATAEGLLRLKQTLSSPVQQYRQNLLDDFVTQIESAYTHQRRNDPFHLPYNIFSNEGYQDQNKLKQVYAGTRYPSGSWISDDFLDKDPAPLYKISINQLGFRGQEYTAEKKPDTKRIIVLGSYHAFGIGVGDDETYPARLEKKLNENQQKTTYEVWNGGRLSAAAIVGLATLKEEKFWELKPDYVVIDYGFVDPLSLNNSSFGVSLAQRLSFHSHLWKALNLNNLIYGVNDNFTGIMKEMMEILRSRKVPFLIVKQLNSLSLDQFPQEFPPGSYPFLNAYSAFAAKLPGPEMWESIPWLRDVPKEYWREMPPTPFAPYMKNIFHYSPAGHEVIASALVEKIQKLK